MYLSGFTLYTIIYYEDTAYHAGFYLVLIFILHCLLHFPMTFAWVIVCRLCISLSTLMI